MPGKPTPPGQVITVFRSRLDEAHTASYLEDAARMGALARTMPGYVEHKMFVADDGERVTIVVFADQASHDAWRDHPEHRAAQRSGIAAYYSEYSIAVGLVIHASTFKRPEG